MNQKRDEINEKELQLKAEALRDEVEKVEARQVLSATVLPQFSERDMRLIQNCKVYADSDPAGLPGHNLMIVVAKLARALGL